MTMQPIVPAYFHPVVALSEWAKVQAAASFVGGIVINVADGPGQMIDDAYVGLAAQLHPAMPVYGYVDLAYGTRATSQILGDVESWRAWYGVDAFFFDQSPSELTASFTEVLRQLRKEPAIPIAVNPGVEPDLDLLLAVDVCVTFEGPDDVYSRQQLSTAPPAQVGVSRLHLVYGVSPERQELTRLRAQAHGATCYATDGDGANPWDHLSPAITSQLRVSA